jgi:hypothetical protein
MSLLSTLDAPEDQGLGATQMHDAAIDAGLVARPERVVTVDEFNTAYREELQAQVERMKADRTVEELEEMEEDGEDDDAIIAQLREKRIAELRHSRLQKTLSQDLPEIDPFDFENSVLVPSRQGDVVLLVYRANHSDSALLQGLLRSFASTHSHILCLQMHSSQAIANLPPQDCPVLLVYRHGKVQKQLVRLDAFAGKQTDAHVLEWVLADAGVGETTLEEDPRIRIEQARKLDLRRQQEADESTDED